MARACFQESDEDTMSFSRLVKSHYIKQGSLHHVIDSGISITTCYTLIHIISKISGQVFFFISVFIHQNIKIKCKMYNKKCCIKTMFHIFYLSFYYLIMLSQIQINAKSNVKLAFLRSFVGNGRLYFFCTVSCYFFSQICACDFSKTFQAFFNR